MLRRYENATRALFSVPVTFKQGARLRAMNEKREGGYAGSDSSSEEEEIEEELGYFSPLDTVNPYETFKNEIGRAHV